jgi:hypothetical protein
MPLAGDTVTRLSDTQLQARLCSAIVATREEGPWLSFGKTRTAGFVVDAIATNLGDRQLRESTAKASSESDNYHDLLRYEAFYSPDN